MMKLKQVPISLIISKTKPIVSELVEKDELENTSKVFMFFSVDLENFTQYKTENKEWASVITNFYTYIVRNVDKAYQNAVVWKYVGDEVLFYIEVDKIEEILCAPASLHTAMMSTQSEIQMNDSSILRLKGALWVAGVKSDTGCAKFGKDISCMYLDLSSEQYTAKSLFKDFIGVDIDEGFRMSKNAAQGKIVIDPKIAFLLVKHADKEPRKLIRKIIKNTKIVGYCFMKGIWKERAYPVIWYADNWSENSILLYDEHFANEYAKNVLLESKEVKPLKHILKIFGSIDTARKSVKIIEEILDGAKKILCLKPTARESID